MANCRPGQSASDREARGDQQDGRPDQQRRMDAKACLTPRPFILSNLGPAHSNPPTGESAPDQIPVGLVVTSWDLQWHCQRSSVSSTATNASTASAGSQTAAHRAISWARKVGTGAWCAQAPTSRSPSIETFP